MLLQLPLPIRKRKNVRRHMPADTAVMELPLSDTGVHDTKPRRRRREPLVQDVAGFISEITRLLDEVYPSDGMRDTVGGLLQRVEADPADLKAWGEARTLQLALYSATHYARARTHLGPQPLSDRDRAEALISLHWAETCGDYDAVHFLQEALAVGRTAVQPQLGTVAAQSKAQ